MPTQFLVRFYILFETFVHAAFKSSFTHEYTERYLFLRWIQYNIKKKKKKKKKHFSNKQREIMMLVEKSD